MTDTDLQDVLGLIHDGHDALCICSELFVTIISSPPVPHQMFWTMSHEWPGVGEMWTMNETIQINITIVTGNMLYNTKTH